MEEQVKRTRRRISTEEKIAALQAKVQSHVDKINELNAQIESLRAPQVTLKEVGARIKELDIPMNDVMKAIEKMGKK